MTGSSSTYSIIDAVELYPQGDNDTEFYIVNIGSPTDETGCTGYTAFVSVCAYADGTSVSVYRKVAGDLILDSTYEIDEYEVITNRTFVSSVAEENFSGYVVRTSNNASVYAGNRCYRYQTSNSLWASIPPVSSLGQTYATYNFDTDAYQYMVKIVATEDDTDVTSSAGDQVNIDEADVVEFGYAGTDLSLVECSKPCIVMQIVNGSSDECGIAEHVLTPTDA